MSLEEALMQHGCAGYDLRDIQVIVRNDDLNEYTLHLRKPAMPPYQTTNYTELDLIVLRLQELQVPVNDGWYDAWED